jgi:hypothetical protein
MIENIIIKEGKKNFYQINIKEGEEYKNLVINLKECYLPFGLETYNTNYLINFEVDKSTEFIKLVRELESNLGDLIENTDLELKSVFHKKPKYNLLCKAHLKSNKNMVITKYNINNNEISVFEIVKCKKYNLEVEISGIWIYKDTFGLYIHINRISTNNI